MRNLSFTVVFGVVSYVLSYFFVPTDLRIFNLVAAVAVMGGYQIGRLCSGKIKRFRIKIIALIGIVVVCFASAMTYAFRIQMGSANTSDIVFLGLLVLVFFFSFGCLLALTSVIIDLKKVAGG
jgi:hypothetical protein